MATTGDAGRVLVIEDASQVAAALKQSLMHAGYAVAVASTGEQGLSELDRGHFDLCVLDLSLPRIDGLEVLSVLRRKSLTMKVIILSARDGAEDRLLGLESGADDYVVKPFSTAELLARIRILLGRGYTVPADVLELEDLRVDCGLRRVTRGNRTIELTPREYDVLTYLMRNQGAIVTRDMLARDIWRSAPRMTPINNVIDVHIAHLRHKMHDLGGAQLLHTVRGVGFMLGQRDVSK
jgi:DNA-binding response OmpR family regulator